MKRRTFLVGGVVAGIVAGATLGKDCSEATGHFIANLLFPGNPSRVWMTDPSLDEKLSENDAWAFLENHGEITPPVINNLQTVPFGAAKFYGPNMESPDSERYHDLIGIVTKALEHVNYEADIINVQSHEFGFPIKNKKVEVSLAQHFRRAVEFLYENVPTLDQYDLWVVPLRSNQDYSQESNHRVFLGSSGCTAYSVVLRNKQTQQEKEETFLVFPWGNRNTSFINRGRNEDGSPDHFSIYLSPNDFVASFSEVIPLTTAQSTFELNRKGYDFGLCLQVEEGVGEAAASKIASEFTRRYNVPRGIEIIAEADTKMQEIEIYGLIPKAIDWIERNGDGILGVQKILGEYRNNPEKMLKELTA